MKISNIGINLIEPSQSGIIGVVSFTLDDFFYVQNVKICKSSDTNTYQFSYPYNAFRSYNCPFNIEAAEIKEAVFARLEELLNKERASE